MSHPKKGIEVKPNFDPLEASTEHLEHDQTDQCPACHAIVDRLTRELESLHRCELAIHDRVQYAIDLLASVVALSGRPDRLVEFSADTARELVNRIAVIADGMGLLKNPDVLKGADRALEDRLAKLAKSKHAIGFTRPTDAPMTEEEMQDALDRLARMPAANKKPC